MDDESVFSADAPNTPTTAAAAAGGGGTKKRRSRAKRGKLRKNLDIDHVKVEEPFTLNRPTESSALNTSSNNNNAGGAGGEGGEGCYVTATVNNRRYYGVLVDQAAMKEASLLHFQNQASGLDLNRRMKALVGQQQEEPASHQPATTTANGHSADHRKRPASSPAGDDGERKRPRAPAPPDAAVSSGIGSVFPPQQVQKFRYNDDGIRGFRVLLATYADVAAAAEDDPERETLIEAACRSGGNYVGEYYYQYEAAGTTLQVSSNQRKKNPAEIKMSLGFQEFLAQTVLPSWHPLSNLQIGQQQVLNLLNLKKDNKGNVLWDEEAEERKAVPLSDLKGSVIPMEPRTVYRVCVVGGGIAGLSACLEIFQKCERENVLVEVVLVEGRSRLGGRLYTDRETFKMYDGRTNFPVDLGASWIHGIDLNPLAALAREAGAEFVRTGEDVKMFKAGMKEVDHEKDKRAGELFDQLLDISAENSWGLEADSVQKDSRGQAAMRWYASVLGDRHEKGGTKPLATDVPDHRRSSDVSVDHAVGNAIAKHKLSEFEQLSEEERRMLFWNLKNVEYALGANLSDLSMKYWDIDDRHAFEGDHVLLRQGYSTVVGHLLQQLVRRGKFFQYHLNCPVGKIEYARKTTSQTYAGSCRRLQLIDLSDTCCVTSEDGSKSFKCDSVVCAVPLGVLKQAVAYRDNTDKKDRIEFTPSLPFLKRDAIESVGFGLLDKVYLQFPWAFWRTGDCRLSDEQALFGNASGVNPHHYMFFDIGKILGQPPVVPAVLMSLVSGKEAVKCECLSEAELVKETMETLRTLFSGLRVPEPIAVRATRWGSDKFSRGSYTFLPPGATDQDFHSMQSPVNGNGDSLLLEGSETMRLFFAGEHTTAMHPSMAHGAMLSGVRAGSEVFAALSLDFKAGDDVDRMIPLSVFRHTNPGAPVECALCHLPGGRAYEGPLLAFKRGSRQVLVHNSCAEYSPEVEVNDGQWKNVLTAVNRSINLECQVCGEIGASIGCNYEHCYKCYHFRCAEQTTNWGFENDGKEFYCEAHRPPGTGTGPSGRPDQGSPTAGGDDAAKDSFQHALFASLPGEESKDGGAAFHVERGIDVAVGEKKNDPVDEGEAMMASIGKLTSELDPDRVLDTRLIRLTRESLQHRWNVEFMTQPLPFSISSGDRNSETIPVRSLLTVADARADDPFEPLVSKGDVVMAINGVKVGSSDLDTVEKVVARLGGEVDVMMEIQSGNLYDSDRPSFDSDSS